uniref:Uncharacterized protein n=1 Tax=Pseudo-nitzschia australis TaxID=44445 RepID=A0A7S4EPF6_9STRA
MEPEATDGQQKKEYLVSHNQGRGGQQPWKFRIFWIQNLYPNIGKNNSSDSSNNNKNNSNRTRRTSPKPASNTDWGPDEPPGVLFCFPLRGRTRRGRAWRNYRR